jgi:hypothetical protein
MNSHVHPVFRGVLYAMSLHAELTVKETRGSSSTEYRLTGSLPSIQTAIVEMFVKFDPRVYDTRVHAIEFIDGKYAARLSHSNS